MFIKSFLTYALRKFFVVNFSRPSKTRRNDVIDRRVARARGYTLNTRTWEGVFIPAALGPAEELEVRAYKVAIHNSLV